MTVRRGCRDPRGRQVLPGLMVRPDRKVPKACRVIPAGRPVRQVPRARPVQTGVMEPLAPKARPVR